MKKLLDLAAARSAVKPHCQPGIALSLRNHIARASETHYVSIENCSDNEMEEEVLMSTRLGRLKTVSVLVCPDPHRPSDICSRSDSIRIRSSAQLSVSRS